MHGDILPCLAHALKNSGSKTPPPAHSPTRGGSSNSGPKPTKAAVLLLVEQHYV